VTAPFIKGTDVPPLASLYDCAISLARETPYWAKGFVMEEQLSRSSAVCRRDRGFRAIVPGVQKSAQARLKNVVVSGLPTAVEASLLRLLPGAHASALPSDFRASQLPLPRDDIPPHPPVVALGVCRLRLARMWFPLALRLHSKDAAWEGRTEFSLGGIKKSIARVGKSGVMCDLRRMKCGKKPAVGLNHFLPILHKPPM
jgi:hypothetical protein